MSLAAEFAKLYTTHVYKDGMIAGKENELTNPRGLARSVDYTGNPLYPHVQDIDVLTGAIEYGYGTAPTNAALDAKPPSFLINSTIPSHLEQSLIAASYIQKRHVVNTDIRKFGASASSQLRVQGAIP